MEMINAIKHRCSTRKYKREQIKREELDLIIEAARKAPTGLNDRKAKIYVFQDTLKISELGKVLADAVSRGNADGVSPDKASFMQEDNYNFCHHAPTFLIITYEKNNYNSLANTGCILENAMLQATDLGIGSCWINIVKRCAKDEGLKSFMKQFGFTENEEITGGLALGYPDEEFRENPKKDGNEVVWI